MTASGSCKVEYSLSECHERDDPINARLFLRVDNSRGYENIVKSSLCASNHVQIQLYERSQFRARRYYHTQEKVSEYMSARGQQRISIYLND